MNDLHHNISKNDKERFAYLKSLYKQENLEFEKFKEEIKKKIDFENSEIQYKENRQNKLVDEIKLLHDSNEKLSRDLSLVENQILDLIHEKQKQTLTLKDKVDFLSFNNKLSLEDYHIQIDETRKSVEETIKNEQNEAILKIEEMRAQRNSIRHKNQILKEEIAKNYYRVLHSKINNEVSREQEIEKTKKQIFDNFESQMRDLSLAELEIEATFNSHSKVQKENFEIFCSKESELSSKRNQILQKLCEANCLISKKRSEIIDSIVKTDITKANNLIMEFKCFENEKLKCFHGFIAEDVQKTKSDNLNKINNDYNFKIDLKNQLILNKKKRILELEEMYKNENSDLQKIRLENSLIAEKLVFSLNREIVKETCLK